MVPAVRFLELGNLPGQRTAGYDEYGFGHRLSMPFTGSGHTSV